MYKDILYRYLYANVGFEIHGCNGPVLCIDKAWVRNFKPTQDPGRWCKPEEIYSILNMKDMHE